MSETIENLTGKVEALLFVHAKPLNARRIADIVGSNSVVPIKEAIERLAERYDANGSAFRVQELAHGFQLTTLPIYDELLSKLVRQREAQKLSPATLEALAIIAYKQPLSRTELENIRGAGSDHLVRALMERDLVKVVERDTSKPGNPALYGTTAEFLRAFGLKSLSELPQEGDLAVNVVNEPTTDDEASIEQADVSTPTDEEE